MNHARQNPVLIFAILWLALAAGLARAQTAPTITQQPQSQTNLAGSNTTLSVTAAGPGPFSYQWQWNGTNLANGIISTVAGGGGDYPGDGGAATNADLYYPYGVAMDLAGDLFIADSESNGGRIREVLANGIIITVAGNGQPGFSGDGTAATNATLSSPKGVTVDASGNVFISDTFNNRVRKVGTNGLITTVAGNGSSGFSGDGILATNSGLNEPLGLALDASGHVWIADTYDYRIREVANGLLFTTAGNGTNGNGTNGYSGNGGAATNAALSQPSGVAFDASGNLFVADTFNNCIRRVDGHGVITTVAGNGANGYSGDGGAATNAKLKHPYGVALDAYGNLFIADTGNQRVREVGTNGTINTVAGNGKSGYLGDGFPATNASFTAPSCVAVDAYGNLFISDSQVSVIRKVIMQGPTILVNALNPSVAGNYDVIITGPGGSVTSAVATITVPSPPVLPPHNLAASLVPGPAVVVQFSGTPGTNYVLQSTTNLTPPVQWQAVFTNTADTNGNCVFADTNVLLNAQLFYRAMLP